MKYILYIVLSLIFVSCFEEEKNTNVTYLKEINEELLYFAPIWNASNHAAFTDLIEFKGTYYCCFRDAINHLPYNKNGYGKIRIMASEDGETWTTASVINDPEYDLRDPKLSIDPLGQLVLLMGSSQLKEGKLQFITTKVTYGTQMTNTKQLSFSKVHDINLSIDQYWLWRITWHKNIAYGIAYDANPNRKNAPILVKSVDGIHYETITYLKEISDSNESDIAFINDEMFVLIRHNNNNGFFGFSSYPFTDWQWHYSNLSIHAPKIQIIEDHIFVLGRMLSGQQGIAYLTNELKYIPVYIYPSKGDSSYPGSIQVKDELWMTYYTTLTNQTSIYLAKTSITKLLDRTKDISK